MRPQSGSKALRISRLPGRALVYGTLVGLSCLFCLPFLWALSASLKSLDQVFVTGHWFPWPIRWDNYVRVFDHIPFHLFFLNSLLVTGACLVGQLTTASLVAFSFARLRWWGRDVCFVLVLSTMMLPGAVTMIPVFILFKHLGWVNTFLPLIVPSFLGGGAFNIFLLRQFFKTIPVDLEDAARMDGCSSLRVLVQVMMPLAKPALVTLAILAFIGHWNDFMDPVIYLDSYRKFTVALGINMFKDSYGIFPQYMMAASMMALAPVLILFFMAQKAFTKGIVMTGMKG